MIYKQIVWTMAKKNTHGQTHTYIWGGALRESEVAYLK